MGTVSRETSGTPGLAFHGEAPIAKRRSCTARSCLEQARSEPQSKRGPSPDPAGLGASEVRNSHGVPHDRCFT
jgi:hypothetical protein